MDRTLIFSAASVTLTLTGDFHVTVDQKSALKLVKLFRSNSIGWGDGRLPRQIVIRGVEKKFDDDGSNPNAAEQDGQKIRDDLLDKSGTLTIDGKTLSGSFTLTRVFVKEIRRYDEYWRSLLDFEFVQL